MRQPPKQHQQDDALLHHLTGRDPYSFTNPPERGFMGHALQAGFFNKPLAPPFAAGGRGQHQQVADGRIPRNEGQARPGSLGGNLQTPMAALAGATAGGQQGPRGPRGRVCDERGAPAVPVADATKGRFWCARTRTMFDIVHRLVQFHAYAMPVYSQRLSLGNLGPHRRDRTSSTVVTSVFS